MAFSYSEKKFFFVICYITQQETTAITGLNKFYLGYLIGKMENETRECLLTHFYNIVNTYKFGEVRLEYKSVGSTKSCQVVKYRLYSFVCFLPVL